MTFDAASLIRLSSAVADFHVANAEAMPSDNHRLEMRFIRALTCSPYATESFHRSKVPATCKCRSRVIIFEAARFRFFCSVVVSTHDWKDNASWI